MLKLLFFALLSGAVWSQENSVGGFYSAQADAAVARVDDASAPYLNPAGLEKLAHDTLSSGASSFKAKNEHRKSGFSLSSSTNHVSYVKTLGDYNLGFMIYTIESNFDSESSSSSSLNDEGFSKNHLSSNSEQTDNNYYIFALAPKNSFWGAALNIASVHIVSQSSDYKQEYAQTDLSNRGYSSSNNITEVNVKLLSVSVGIQSKWKQFLFGLKAESPLFIVFNDSKSSMNGISAGAVGTNDVFIAHYHADSKVTPQKQFMTDGRLLVGAAYSQEKFRIELDLTLLPAQANNNFRLEKSLTSGIWQSQTDDFSETEPAMENSSADYDKASVQPSIGADYKVSQDFQLGVGASYIPTTSKNGEGYNQFKFTAGFSQKYKNFAGSYSLVYLNAKDAGKNHEYNNQTGKDEKVDLSHSTMGVVFSGAYYF